MQTIKPAKGYLFCKPEEAVKQTASGFYLSENAAEKPKVAEVINIGADVSAYSVNDKIVYKSYASTDVKLDGKDYLLIASEDILGKVIEL